MANEALLYIAQKALIEKDGKVLVVFEPTFGLDFPGGKLQENDLTTDQPIDLENSLKREVAEETGLNIKVVRPYAVWYFTFLRKTHPLVGKKAYTALFLCKHIGGEVALSSEHNKFEWADKENYEKFNDGSDGFAALKKYFDGN